MAVDLWYLWYSCLYCLSASGISYRGYRSGDSQLQSQRGDRSTSCFCQQTRPGCLDRGNILSMMANTLTAYRDMVGSDRNVDVAAMLAYLEDISGQSTPPLPPLAPARRMKMQNLPPVRNLLTPTGNASPSKQNRASIPKQNHTTNAKVNSHCSSDCRSHRLHSW